MNGNQQEFVISGVVAIFVVLIVLGVGRLMDWLTAR